VNQCGVERDDLTGSRWSLLLWRVPWLLVLIGYFSNAVARTALWSVGFTVGGIACLINARRCGRLHCFYTGPLYLGAAAASLLYGMGLLPLGPNGWDWIVGVAIGGSLIAQLGLERLLGRYTERHGVE
jgi:hypothetical protein